MSLNRPETLFNQCQELMTSRIGSSMEVVMNQVEETLFDMAMKEKSSGKAVMYLEAVRTMRMKKYEIPVRFKNRFVSLYQYRLRNAMKNREITDVTLSRVGHSSFTKSIDSLEGHAMQESVQKIRDDCRSALLNLDRKIGALLENSDSEPLVSPMSPETIFEAFWESCRDVEIKSEIRLLLMHLFEKYVALDLKYLYEDLNTHLSDQDSSALFTDTLP